MTSLVQSSVGIVIGGIFRLNDQVTRNLALLPDCVNSTCGNQDWVSLNQQIEFSEASAVVCLAIYNNLLLIGGTFELTLGEDTAQNFAIYDLEQKSLLKAGLTSFDQGRTPSDVVCEVGLFTGCPVVETFKVNFVLKLFCAQTHSFSPKIINSEVWIGGTFSMQKEINPTQPYPFESIARFDLESMAWLPILGLLRQSSASAFPPATVSAIEFYFPVSDDADSDRVTDENIVTKNLSNIAVEVFIGGVFFEPSVNVKTISLYNVALSCLTISNGSFESYGILTEQDYILERSQRPVREKVTTSTNDLCKDSDGSYVSVGGVNGPVEAITVFEEHEGVSLFFCIFFFGFPKKIKKNKKILTLKTLQVVILVAGSFTATVGLIEKEFSVCNILSYNPSKNHWDNLEVI